MKTVKAGYEKLAEVYQAAHDQAAYGKGCERHGNGLPFHDQRMLTIAEMIGSDKGMVQQVIKKMLEGLEFTSHKKREAELLGALNYLAGIVIYHRQKEELNRPEWTEKTDQAYDVLHPGISKKTPSEWQAGDKVKFLDPDCELYSQYGIYSIISFDSEKEEIRISCDRNTGLAYSTWGFNDVDCFEWVSRPAPKSLAARRMEG